MTEREVLAQERNADPGSGGAYDQGGGMGGGGEGEGEGLPQTAMADPGMPRSGAASRSGVPGSGDNDIASDVPPDIGSAQDDDIIARQLREAAMKEQDPALREKLWDEYRKYKRGG